MIADLVIGSLGLLVMGGMFYVVGRKSFKPRVSGWMCYYPGCRRDAISSAIGRYCSKHYKEMRQRYSTQPEKESRP